MLTLEVELLTGAYRASLPDGSGGEWPPHPERVFSALVQAWGDGLRAPSERAALEWLEALEPPAIEATAWVSERTAPTVYVPPNDARGSTLEAMPDRRRRQARTFQVRTPEDPRLLYRWDATASEETRSALRALASRVASLGHSASLARFAFPDSSPDPEDSRLWRPCLDGTVSLRATYPGRLADLEAWFAGDGPDVERPRSRRTARYREPRSTIDLPVVESVFAGPDGWFVFEDAGSEAGFRPDLLAFAHVARRVRDALMSRGPQPPAEIVSGHGPGDRPSVRPHLAIVPLANVGWEHSGGELLGFAIVLPREASVDERRAVIESLVGLVSVDRDRTAATLRLSHDATWHLERSPRPSRSSLRPDRWCAEATTWASATPMLLDRFPEGGDPVEEARLVASACIHIGLPEPAEVEIHKHSALVGAPSAYPGRGRKHGEWTFPHGSKISERPRRHVVIRFAGPVRGPVLLGAGRYHGFGLLLPIEGLHGGSETRA